MDYMTFQKAFGVSNNEFAERFGIAVLNQETYSLFRDKMELFRTTKEELKDLVRKNMPIDSWEEKGHVFPNLFIDFDNKRLYSLFPELTRFEEFVPRGWEGKYEDFYNKVPIEEKYWVIDGVDYLSNLQ